MAVNANITPVAVQAFQITQTVNANTYTLVAGTANKKIRLISYYITSSAGTVTIQDSAGVIFAVINSEGGLGNTGIVELTTGADLQAVVSATTNISAYFMGFMA